MMLPTISQYSESISQSHGLFKTLKSLSCEYDIYGDPIIMSGGNAAIFKVIYLGKPYALKCYTKARPYMAQLYEKISTITSPLIYPTKYLPEEIFIFDMSGDGCWHDILLSQWADGTTLEYEIQRAIHYQCSDIFASLAIRFDTMAQELLSQSWAHGDLKPSNISVETNGTMKLLDYDALFISDAEHNHPSHEIGTPQYQHPLRTENTTGKFIDDYSITLLSATLHSLAIDPLAHSLYGTNETLLFNPIEITNGTSIGLKAMKKLSAQKGNSHLYRLLSLLESPTPKIDLIHKIISNTTPKTHPTPLSQLSPYYEKGAWGYQCADKNIIAPLFDNALEFSCGLAIIELGTTRHFINPSGQVVINCEKYDQIKSFSQGVAAVNHHGLWGYIGIDGNVIIAPKYLSASSFRDGIAQVTTTKDTIRLTLEELQKGSDTLHK